METTKTPARTRWVHLRLTPAEHDKLKKNLAKTTCRKMSEFVRKQLFAQPVVASYRNASIDDALPEVVRLRQELNALGNNLNQAVKKLHTTPLPDGLKDWVVRFDFERRVLESKVEEIRKHIAQLATSWLQS